MRGKGALKLPQIHSYGSENEMPFTQYKTCSKPNNVRCVCVWECVCVCVCSPVFITEAWDLLSLQENMFLQPVSEEWVLEQLDLQATRLV